jgi:hypothetical protein
MSAPGDDERSDHEGGQVSEVAGLDREGASTPIADGDAIGGYPDSESGRPDEGDELGPDADQFRDRPVR